MKALTELIYNWLVTISLSTTMSARLATLIVGLSILLLAILSYYIVRGIEVKFAIRLSKRTKTEWDDIIIKHKTLNGIAHVVPATIIYFTANFASDYSEWIEPLLLKTSEIYFLFAIIFVLNAMLSSINEIYNKSFSFSKERPIAGFTQLIKIFTYFVGVLVVISIVFDKELSGLLTGMGAMAAILLLVFKDAILGFVASIQISMNDMVKIGDWIEMPSRGADGDVIEISLTTVKVQNWDKTISMLPTYSLISESFINWKGMELSGGRRIKRSINIDMSSVKFCNQETLEKFKKFSFIRDYVIQKQDEIEEFNRSLKVDPEDNYNGRRQTNLGVFRKYLEAYLHQNENINQEMTFLIRHLQPTEKGLPIEIYVFCKDQRWANFEAIQADIFDHVLAVLPHFELKVFQNPTGSDFQQLVHHS